MSLVEKLKNKLDEYDFNRVKSYEREENGIYYFGINEALLYLEPKKKKLGISFLVFAKPEVVANTALILSEIDGLDEIEILDSFVVTQDQKFLIGEEAHAYYSKSYLDYIKKQCEFEKMQQDLLKSMDDSKFGRC